jgi:plasmid stabilization system protein ParE
VSRFVVTPEARQDVLDIWDYVARNSLDAAERVVDRIETAFEKLADAPGIGHFREDLLDQRYRFWSVHSYLIAYRWDVKPIQIIAVVHGARDLEVFFDDWIE